MEDPDVDPDVDPDLDPDATQDVHPSSNTTPSSPEAYGVGYPRG
jgi:hypothetical protein